jgi:hypothetical protein
MSDILSGVLPTTRLIRQELQELILGDLLGPAGGEEEVVYERLSNEE